MICAIHQPQYLPYIGYFHKMACCDVFVFLDDVQYKKNEWQNRNRIKTASGEQYLTVPVHYKFPAKIKDVGIDTHTGWAKKHAAGLEMNYMRAQYFNKYYETIRNIINKEWDNLASLNTRVTLELADMLEIKCKTLSSSSLPVEGESTDRLINICKHLGADTYLSGSGGKGYLIEERFAENKITLKYQSFHCPEYPQVPFKEQKSFLPNLSIVDLLFNCGHESLSILMKDQNNL